MDSELNSRQWSALEGCLRAHAEHIVTNFFTLDDCRTQIREEQLPGLKAVALDRAVIVAALSAVGLVVVDTSGRITWKPKSET